VRKEKQPGLCVSQCLGQASNLGLHAFTTGSLAPLAMWVADLPAHFSDGLMNLLLPPYLLSLAGSRALSKSFSSSSADRFSSRIELLLFLSKRAEATSFQAVSIARLIAGLRAGCRRIDYVSHIMKIVAPN
jgi:hypothetical protein